MRTFAEAWLASEQRGEAPIVEPVPLDVAQGFEIAGAGIETPAMGHCVLSINNALLRLVDNGLRSIAFANW